MIKKLQICGILLILGCTPYPVKHVWIKKTAPETFKARFETTYGAFEIEAVREWSPQGVDRLYQLIRYGYYQNIAIHRVVPDYVAQFGISMDQEFYKGWRDIVVPDEPVIESNKEGTIAFARSGPNTRCCQIYINLKDNSHLDTITYQGLEGFPVVARVTEGMDLVQSFFNEYGNEPALKEDSIRAGGNRYLQNRFPELDYIEEAYLIH